MQARNVAGKKNIFIPEFVIIQSVSLLRKWNSQLCIGLKISTLMFAKIFFMCEFQSLYYGSDGYVVKCNICGHYQLGFASIMLTLQRNDFISLSEIVAHKMTEDNYCENENSKSVVLATPYYGIKILLTRQELKQLNSMLEEADVEEKTQSLINLFNFQKE